MSSRAILKAAKYSAFKAFLASNPELVEMRDPPRVYFLDASRGLFPRSVVAQCVEDVESQGRANFKILDADAANRQIEAENRQIEIDIQASKAE